jgi:hypothetical protein|eukprot:Transcript_14449.p2 GENE.Transcript_14449~~Transcript_14449.p2  ORF type:complete len:283 (-),score=29.67 Transcript_14449:63-911(-)
MLSLLTDYSETTVEYDDVRQTLLGWSQGGCSTVWSEVLPRIICRQGESMLGGCSVLELGAGCGLLGLLAGNWASRVDITDGDEEEVALIATNIEQHAPAGAELHAAFLDWQHPEDAAAQLLGKEAYDVVLASQVAYMPTFIPGLARTIRYYLSPAGTAYLYNDQARGPSRAGIADRPRRRPPVRSASSPRWHCTARRRPSAARCSTARCWQRGCMRRRCGWSATAAAVPAVPARSSCRRRRHKRCASAPRATCCASNGPGAQVSAQKGPSFQHHVQRRCPKW